MKPSRRQFFRNISLAGLSLGATPLLKARGKTKSTATGDCNPTTLDLYGQGPFYTPNAPTLADGQLAESGELGDRMIISGRVMTLDCTQFIPNTVIDVWQANDAGEYDNSGFNLRGVTTSNAQGFYMFETIRPGKYLNGNQFRPSHIHFRITPPGYPTFITQLYFEGDTSIPIDAAASVTSGTFDATDRIIPLTTNAANILEGTWDIMVDGEGISSASDIHLERGMIYDVSPNPSTDQFNVRYGIFQKAKVGLKVFDMQGRFISELEEQVLSPEKYEASWAPDSTTANGYYFIALQINDIQVHYLKVHLAR